VHGPIEVGKTPMNKIKAQGQMSVMAMLRQSPVVPVSVLEPAAVNIGISNGAKTEVLSGLKESDQVVLQ